MLSISRSRVPSSGFALSFEDFSCRFDRIGVLRSLVRAQSHDPRKPQRVAAFMAVRLHHVVECDLQYNLWLDGTAETLIFDGVLKKPLGHLGDFGVGQSRISLANI